MGTASPRVANRPAGWSLRIAAPAQAFARPPIRSAAEKKANSDLRYAYRTTLERQLREHQRRYAEQQPDPAPEQLEDSKKLEMGLHWRSADADADLDDRRGRARRHDRESEALTLADASRYAELHVVASGDFPLAFAGGTPLLPRFAATPAVRARPPQRNAQRHCGSEERLVRADGHLRRQA